MRTLVRIFRPIFQMKFGYVGKCPDAMCWFEPIVTSGSCFKVYLLL